MAILSEESLKKMGFKHVGKNVSVSDKASFWNTKGISIGDNSRIDDFCVLSAGAGGIEIGRNVHVAVFCSLIGAAKITLSDFSCISGRVSIYSSSDDFSGPYMSNSTIPDRYKNVRHAEVTLDKHALVGTSSVLLPGAVVGEWSRVNAMSLVYNKLDPLTQYGGVPAEKIRDIDPAIKQVEKEFLAEES